MTSTADNPPANGQAQNGHTDDRGTTAGHAGNGHQQEAAAARNGNGFVLPPRVPRQAYRVAQSNVPNDRATRDRLKALTTGYVAATELVPPVPLDELREHAQRILAGAAADGQPLDPVFTDYVAVLVNNAAWRDTLAQIPYERRLLLLPKCLRVEEHCPAPFDEFGLLCKECGLCSIQDLTAEGERLGYAVLVAEGSAIVRQMVETGRIDAVVGVSCLNVLERSFPHMEAAAVPGIAIPLLNDDCINCTVDMDWVWDVIHLTAEDRTWRLDLDGLKDEVQGFFTAASLDAIMGPAGDATGAIARDWLLRSGKRWRPFLATCVNLALQHDLRDEQGGEPAIDPGMQKLAVAIECFHKASLIHDDIEDGDTRRYGEPTVHAEQGVEVGINIGDFLLGEGYRLIAEVDAPAEAKVAMLQAAARGHGTLCRGQGEELLWTRDPGPLTSVDVLKIFSQKTAPAFEVALQLGALYAGAGAAVFDVIAKYSEALGIAYQIRDDLDDFAGEGDSHDLRSARPSVILAIAGKRARQGEEQELIEAVWRRQVPFDQVEGRVRRLLAERGVIDKTSELLDAYEEQAVRSLRFLPHATMKGLLRRVVGKIFPRTLIEGYCSEFEARNAAGREAGASTPG